MSVKPLGGLRIAITRPQEQADAFAKRLEALGAVVIRFPTIAIAPPSDTGPIDRAITHLSSYDWVVFTSVNGVDHLWRRAAAIGADMEAIRRCRVAAIGPATADALRTRGVEPDLVPDEFIAEAILDVLPDVRGLRFLLPRADIARPVLRDELTARRAQVDQVAAYRTVPARPDPAALREGVDVIAFTSASTVRNFVSLVGDELDGLLSGAQVACIGPITARAARELDLPVHIVASDYTVEGLIEAILAASQTPARSQAAPEETA
jgi:uroporphyrinogen-III synthase